MDRACSTELNNTVDEERGQADGMECDPVDSTKNVKERGQADGEDLVDSTKPCSKGRSKKPKLEASATVEAHTLNLELSTDVSMKSISSDHHLNLHLSTDITMESVNSKDGAQNISVHGTDVSMASIESPLANTSGRKFSCKVNDLTLYLNCVSLRENCVILELGTCGYFLMKNVFLCVAT